MKTRFLTQLAVVMVAYLLLPGLLQAQQLNKKAFELINLDYPGLSDVKRAYNQNDMQTAAEALLVYYRGRTQVLHPELDLAKVKLTTGEQQKADEALSHILYAHEGYQPSFYYGKDIDWTYWPIKDNELRWQLHRQKWFIPMGKAYYTTRDEKYAKEWAFQYMDWVKKNPLVAVTKEEFELASTGEVRADSENARFAWRPLEVGTRLEDQTQQFMLLKEATSFTPEFLTEFLVNYRIWAKLFPKNDQIRYFATEGQEGKLPGNLSKGFLNSGFFTFRNGWKNDATVMVVKAGPEGEWHNQPDNGTFELWFKGTNLFPDTGFYVYAGDDNIMKLRNWFRQTMVHKTLTLDNKNLETQTSITRLWKPEGKIQTLVTENQSYKELKHRRSVFFVDQKYFVIVDEAVGDAKGKIGLHYQMNAGKVAIDSKECILTSNYGGMSNAKLQCFAPQGATLEEEEGWQSTLYLVREGRKAVSFNVEKQDATPVRYITIIYPTEDSSKAPKMSARFVNQLYDENSLKVEVVLDGAKKVLDYKL